MNFGWLVDHIDSAAAFWLLGVGLMTGPAACSCSRCCAAANERPAPALGRARVRSPASRIGFRLPEPRAASFRGRAQPRARGVDDQKVCVSRRRSAAAIAAASLAIGEQRVGGVPGHATGGSPSSTSPGTLDSNSGHLRLSTRRGTEPGRSSPTDPARRRISRPTPADGERIVFSPLVAGDAGFGQIWVMNADGSGQTQLTNGPPDRRRARTRHFSPTASRIVFERFNGSDEQIWIMNADGTGQTQLTIRGGRRRSRPRAPTFSPDGQKIAFSHFRRDHGLPRDRRDEPERHRARRR